MAHGASLQARDSASVGQTRPLCWSGVVTVRARVCAPAPHDLVHDVQGCHMVTSQCTGHGPLLQASRRTCSAGQALPPKAAATLTVRCIICVPTPHVVVHGVQTAQPLSSQSMGQRTRWHGCEAERASHALPPNSGSRATPRKRTRSPMRTAEEHERSHAPHAPHCAMRQSTAHAWSLQTRASCVCTHSLPPCCADHATERVRDWWPAPHVVEQEPHASQSLSLQSIGSGHFCVLHARSARRCGQL